MFQISESWWHYVFQLHSVWDIVTIFMIPVALFIATILIFLLVLTTGREQAREGV